METAVAGSAESSESVTVTFAVRSANAGAHQAAGPVTVFELSKHGQAVVERTHGTGTTRTMKTTSMKTIGNRLAATKRSEGGKSTAGISQVLP